MNDPVALEPPELQPALNIHVLPLIGDSVICTDEDGRIVVFNRAAEHSFGFSAGEVIGQPVEMLLPHSDRAKHLGYVRDFASGGQRGSANGPSSRSARPAEERGRISSRGDGVAPNDRWQDHSHCGPPGHLRTQRA